MKRRGEPGAPALDTLPARAAEVARDDARLRTALAEEGSERAALLRQALAGIQPAIPALLGRIPLSSVVRVGTDRSESDEVRAYYSPQEVPVRGVHVAGDAAPRKDLPSSPSGALRGRGIWLLEDGRFLELSYTGAWSKSGPEASNWRAAVRELPLVDVAREALEDVLARLSAALEQQNPGGRAAAAEVRVARLRAILTLLGDLR